MKIKSSRTAKYNGGLTVTLYRFDANQDFKVNQDDAVTLMANFDEFDDGGINRSEFNMGFSDTLYELVYEDALADPEAWIKKTAQVSETDAPENDLFFMLDTDQNGKLDETEFKQLTNWEPPERLTNEMDDQINKRDLVNYVFQDYRGVAAPFRDRIINALSNLNRHTVSPFLIQYKDWYYYVSSADQKLGWKLSNRFCEKLGGNLLSFKTKEELDFIVRSLNIKLDSYWIGLYNDKTWTDDSKTHYLPPFDEEQITSRHTCVELHYKTGGLALRIEDCNIEQ